MNNSCKSLLDKFYAEFGKEYTVKDMKTFMDRYENVNTKNVIRQAFKYVDERYVELDRVSHYTKYDCDLDFDTIEKNIGNLPEKFRIVVFNVLYTGVDFDAANTTGIGRQTMQKWLKKYKVGATFNEVRRLAVHEMLRRGYSLDAIAESTGYKRSSLKHFTTKYDGTKINLKWKG